MKKVLLVTSGLLLALGAFGQGVINFNNRVTGSVIAPIFGVDPSDPHTLKQGNPASYNPAPVPTGTQNYGQAAPLQGAGFTASLWAANTTLADDQLQSIATAPFRVTTSATLWGFWQPPSGAQPTVPGVVGGGADRAKFQVRVWDNRGGTITSWAQVLADDSVARGWSTIFVVNAPLGQVGTPPNLVGLEGFNLYTPVPEPSVIALGVLGAGCLFMLRRRK